MQPTTNLIAEVENKWLIVLYNSCKKQFNDIPRNVRATLDDYSKQYFEQLDQEISKNK
ncbi:MAG: hypothetical protein ACOC4J_05725 [Bacteroidota bacterium]